MEFHVTATPSGLLGDSCLVLADGATYHGSVPGALKGNPQKLDEVELVGDRTLSILRSEADALGSKLPATDPQLQAAGKLLGWLRHAASAPAPARLVLTDRVIEQVSGWAGISDRSRFTREHLQPAWAYNRIREEIVSATVQAITAIRFSPDGDQKYLDVLNNGDLAYKPGESIDLAGVLRQIDWLLALLPAGHPPEARLRAVRDKTVAGQATAAWWDKLAGDFMRIERRANRTRNALVHGGPIASRTVDAVVNFREAIARDAMAGAIYALMRDVNPVDHFIGRRDRLTPSPKAARQRHRAADRVVRRRLAATVEARRVRWDVCHHGENLRCVCAPDASRTSTARGADRSGREHDSLGTFSHGELGAGRRSLGRHSAVDAGRRDVSRPGRSFPAESAPVGLP